MARILLGLLATLTLVANAKSSDVGAFEAGSKAKPLKINVGFLPANKGLEIKIGGIAHTFAGKTHYLSFPDIGTDADFRELLRTKNVETAEPDFNNVLLAVVGQQVIYYNGKRLLSWVIPSLKESDKPSRGIEVEFDSKENFDFLIKAQVNGIGRIYVVKENSVWESVKLKYLSEMYLSDVTLKSGELLAKDLPPIYMKPVEKGTGLDTGDPGEEEEQEQETKQLEPNAGVLAALEILEEVQIEVDDTDVPLAEFLKTKFDVMDTPIARRSDFEGFTSEIQMASAGLTMSQGGGIRVTGRPGTGKSYFMETFASYLLETNQEPAVYLRISASSLVGGDGNLGPTERKIEAIKLASKNVKVVLFIDEIHTLVGAGRYKGNDVDFFQHLKTELASGQIKIIGTTTDQEWEENFSGDQALVERFPIHITIKEPPDAKVLEILASFSKKEMGGRNVKTTPEFLERVLSVSKRFDPIAANPRKAIRLLDYSISMAHAQGLSEIDEAHLVKYASLLYGYDLQQLEPERIRARVMGLTAYLDKVLVGLSDAKSKIKRALGGHYFDQFSSSISTRPLSILLYGKRGVGKTALATETAKGLGYGFKKIMMANYAASSVDQFLAHLGVAIRTNPYSVILLDEIEKAPADVQQALLQLMDDGRFEAKLSESYSPTAGGRTEIDASKVVFILTTNAGKDLAGKNVSDISFQDEAEADGVNPYLLDRIGEFIAIANSTEEELGKIAALKWSQYKQSLSSRGVAVESDDAAIVDFIVRTATAAEFQRQTVHKIGMTPGSRAGSDLELSVREIERRIANLAKGVANYFLKHPEQKTARLNIRDGRVGIGDDHVPVLCEDLLVSQ